MRKRAFHVDGLEPRRLRGKSALRHLKALKREQAVPKTGREGPELSPEVGKADHRAS